MALLRLDSFPTLQRSGTVPIGRMPERRIVKLTLSRLDTATNRVTFLPEEVEAAYHESWKIVPYLQQRDGEVIGKTGDWSRAELQVPSSSRQIRPGMDWVLGRELTACWTTQATFKKPNTKGARRHDNPLLNPFRDETAMKQHLESLDYDYWETGKYLTAGLSFHGIPFENFRNNKHSNLYHGICENMEACCDALRDDEHVKWLSEMANAKRLQFWPSQIQTSECYRSYHPRLMDELNSLLYHAIRQSLAGPMKDDERFLGQPVANLVEWYFKDLLYWKNRRLVEDDRGRRDVDVNSLQDPMGD